MKICRVVAPVVSTIKHSAYDGHKLFAVRELDEKLADTDHEFVALDHVQAGEGDIVLVMAEGNGVRQILETKSAPIRSLIVGIVDAVDA